MFPYDPFNNAKNFNLLVLLWFVILDTQGNQLGNLRIRIPGIHAILTKFESQSKMGNYILKLPIRYSDKQPWFQTISLYT